ncbi:MAG: vitamin B12 dependent methionine synthase, partial [Clostridia bacterium]|nr:vitamin B12 dependent methionine synthase [Clostridia bacterium]
MKIEKSELLRYLGYKGQEYGERLEEEIDGAIRLCLNLITPRSVIRKYPFDSRQMKLVGADIRLLGEDIRRHLSGCNEVYFLGATVGFGVEKRVAELMKTNPLVGVLLDSASIC